MWCGELYNKYQNEKQEEDDDVFDSDDSVVEPFDQTQWFVNGGENLESIPSEPKEDCYYERGCKYGVKSKNALRRIPTLRSETDFIARTMLSLVHHYGNPNLFSLDKRKLWELNYASGIVHLYDPVVTRHKVILNGKRIQFKQKKKAVEEEENVVPWKTVSKKKIKRNKQRARKPTDIYDDDPEFLFIYHRNKKVDPKYVSEKNVYGLYKTYRKGKEKKEYSKQRRARVKQELKETLSF